MDAIERQVPQVKRKNSTSCNPPDASETAAGSVAWRLGPREVGTTWMSAIWVGGTSVASGAEISVGTAVSGMDSTVGRTGEVVGAGAQADAAKTAIRLTVRKKRRDFIIILLFND
jgi:hypothetical protein